MEKLPLICSSNNAKIAPFSKLSNFYFDMRPPTADPRARQARENQPQGQLRMCESPGVTPGEDGGQAWN